MKNIKTNIIKLIVIHRVKNNRLLLELIQRRIGEELGIDVQQVQKYMTGINIINYENLHNLAKFFRIFTGNHNDLNKTDLIKRR